MGRVHVHGINEMESPLGKISFTHFLEGTARHFCGHGVKKETREVRA